MSAPVIPAGVASDARAVADWFIWNHTGETCVGVNVALIDDLALVLTEFRGEPMSPSGLTQQQAGVLSFIRTFIAARGYSPTYAEIAAGVGLMSKGRICAIIGQLEERGFVRRLRQRARSITIVGRA